MYDVDILSDGSIIACGQDMDPNDTFPQQAWLLRIDANGCMDDGGCGYDPIPLSIEPVMEQLTVFKLFPNPVKDVCNLTLSSDCLGGVLQLTDFNGCELQQWSVNNTQLQLNLNHHPPGTYLLHIIRDDGLKISKKVVVERK